MHPLVRDLYKRVLIVGRDYPTGIDHVKAVWKKALRDTIPGRTEVELLHAVNKGRYMVKEMIGVIQIKKYRTMKQRYGSESTDLSSSLLNQYEKLYTP